MPMNPNEPEITDAQEEIRNPEVTYDTTDLSARAVVMFLIFLAIGGMLITFAVWGVYKYIAGAGPGERPTVSIGTSAGELTGVGGDPALRFPPPRLQPDPVADMNKFRVLEEERLNSYGWIDQANGKIHIPIERAIELTAAAGLPVRPGAAGFPPQGPVPPGDRGAAAGINVPFFAPPSQPPAPRQPATGNAAEGTTTSRGPQ